MPENTKSAVRMIAEERNRQEEEEGWNSEHDDAHTSGELATAAAVYVWPAPRPVVVKTAWPWERRWWKPSVTGSTEERIRELVKAGALVVAEIERLQRASNTEQR